MVEAASNQLWTDKQKADSEVERPWVVILPRIPSYEGKERNKGEDGKQLKIQGGELHLLLLLFYVNDNVPGRIYILG